MALHIHNLHNGYGDAKILHGITATLPENILDAKQAATIALDYTPGDEQTWYFDHDGNPTETASPGGYYRKALGQTADGRRVVQGRVEVFGDGIGGDGGQGVEGKGEGKEQFFYGVLRRGMYGRFMLSASPPAAP